MIVFTLAAKSMLQAYWRKKEKTYQKFNETLRNMVYIAFLRTNDHTQCNTDRYPIIADIAGCSK